MFIMAILKSENICINVLMQGFICLCRFFLFLYHLCVSFSLCVVIAIVNNTVDLNFLRIQKIYSK